MRTLYTFAFFSLSGALFTGCSNDNLEPVYVKQVAGKVVIRGYNAMADSLQVTANGKFLEIGDRNSFKGEISNDYEFVFYNNKQEDIKIINKATGEVLRSYSFTDENPIDTLSFYANDGIYLDELLPLRPGILSTPGKTGYRFIFPTMGRYSGNVYDGPLDAVIRRTSGEVVGIAENITKDSFSTFVEFNFASPPILNAELVRHGTNEPYIPGQQVIVQMVMQNNKSRLVVLNEKADENGTFTKVEGTIDLVNHFD